MFTLDSFTSSDAPAPRGVLVTRPEPGGAETAERLAALGWHPILAPALVLTARPIALPRCQAVLLTSRAAARALPPGPPGLKLLAVGAATAEAAEQAGWTRTRHAAGTATDLARLAGATLDPAGGPLLLAVGQGYAQDLALALRAQGFRVLRRIAYAATPADRLPPAALTALRDGMVRKILFHSPRSAGCAINLIREAGHAATIAGMQALAISQRVAEAARRSIAPLAWHDLRVATHPNEDALLALLGPGSVPDRAAHHQPAPGDP